MLGACEVALLRAASAQGETEIVALTGQAAPDSTGTADGTFDRAAGTPVLNDSGLAAFGFQLAGASGDFPNTPEGIWVGGGGLLLRQIARQGDATANGTIGGVFAAPVLNNAGQVSFQARLNDTTGGFGVDDLAVFRGAGAALTEIVRLGLPALDGDGEIAVVGPPVLNDSGAVAVLISYGETASGLPERAIIIGSGGALTQIAREADPAAGGGTFFRLFTPSLGLAGLVAFRAQLDGSPGGEGIFLGTAAPAAKITGTGAPSPDGDGSFGLPRNPLLNANNQVAFRANMIGLGGGGSEDALFVGGAAGLTKVARANDPAPGGTFEGGFEHALNNLGVLGFTGSVDVGSTSENGVFRGSGGAVTEIARQGESAAGSGRFLFFGDPAINDSNVVAFNAGVDPGPGGTGDEGVFLGDGEDLVAAVRTGQALAGSTISSLEFAGGDNDLGGSNGLNEFGQIAYQATLADARELISIFTPDLHWRRSQPAGDWDARDNWTLGLAPGAPHDVFIDPQTDVNVLGPASAASIESLRIGGDAGIATLTLQENVTLSVLDEVIVESNGILTGEGTILGNVRVTGGRIASGGALGLGDFSMDPDSILRLALDGTGAGQFDVLTVVGSVALAGDLEIALGFAPSPGDSFLTLANDGQDAIAGIFSDGALTTATFGGRTFSFELDYAGGSGNDLVLTVVPEPAALLPLVLSALLLRARRERLGV